jgi:hypothetical protein
MRVCYFVAPSLTRGRVCNLLYNCFCALPEQLLLGRGPAELTTIFYCFISDSLNLEGQALVFVSPRKRVAQLYPRALRSLFVASYDSQGYGGDILTRRHPGRSLYYLFILVHLPYPQSSTFLTKALHELCSKKVKAKLSHNRPWRRIGL